MESIQHVQCDKYLVTTHVDSHKILTRCQALGLKLIPKHLLPYVSISLKASSPTASVSAEPIDAVLIDDEPYNHEFLQFAAKLKHKTLLTFISFEAFLVQQKEIPFKVPIYVDLNLKGPNADGLVVAKRVYDLGYKAVYIATGYADFEQSDYPWLSGVNLKDPPF